MPTPHGQSNSTTVPGSSRCETRVRFSASTTGVYWRRSGGEGNKAVEDSKLLHHSDGSNNKVMSVGFLTGWVGSAEGYFRVHASTVGKSEKREKTKFIRVP